ncbi:MAG: DedA family protein [Gemmatimonadales bacterium]
MIAVSAIIENFFPPTPSDVFVVLAAFLSHRGALDPVTIFLVAWGFGVLGAIVVYLAARHFGRRFLDSRMGRRMVTPAGFASIEREYLRFGVAGIFITRLLPGFRAFVAPFAGFVNLPPRRALIPIALAAGTWFGALTFLGSTVGSEWETIRRILGGLNRTLGIVAAVLGVLLLLWILRRRRRRAEASLWDAVHLAFKDDEEEIEQDPALAGAAALLIELARQEHGLTDAQLEEFRERVRERWGITSTVAALQTPPGAISPDHQAEVSRVVRSRYGLASRERLAERLRRLTRADALLSRFESRLMQRAAELLGVPRRDAGGGAEAGGPG